MALNVSLGILVERIAMIYKDERPGGGLIQGNRLAFELIECVTCGKPVDVDLVRAEKQDGSTGLMYAAVCLRCNQGHTFIRLNGVLLYGIPVPSKS